MAWLGSLFRCARVTLLTLIIYQYLNTKQNKAETAKITNIISRPLICMVAKLLCPGFGLEMSGVWFGGVRDKVRRCPGLGVAVSRVRFGGVLG